MSVSSPSAGVGRLSAIASRSTSSVIADQLRERIVDGSFGAGEQINEAQVAAQLGVSRGPVREALQRLSQEGLLDARPNRGVFVRELTAIDVEEIYAAREVLECAAAEVLVERTTEERAEVKARLDAVIADLAAAVDAEDWPRVCRLDLAFHTQIVRESGNSRLERAYLTLAAEALMSMIDTGRAYPTTDRIVADHQHISELLATATMHEIHEALHQHLTLNDSGPGPSSSLLHGRDVTDTHTPTVG